MTILSLLAALTVALLWVRSTFWASDLIEKRWLDQRIYLASTAGWLILENKPDHLAGISQLDSGPRTSRANAGDDTA